MGKGDLGKTYSDGEIITRQGDVGDCMFVIQQGKVQVLVEKDGVETALRVANEGEFMGEMAIFDHEERSATLRALGEARLLTIDKKNFLKRVHKDPSLAFGLVQDDVEKSARSQRRGCVSEGQRQTRVSRNR